MADPLRFLFGGRPDIQPGGTPPQLSTTTPPVQVHPGIRVDRHDIQPGGMPPQFGRGRAQPTEQDLAVGRAYVKQNPFTPRDALRMFLQAQALRRPTSEE
jgi:hypothetical protein